MTLVADPPTPAAVRERITIREYFSAQNDLYTKTDAKRIGPELERLAAKGKTKLKDVVDAARPAVSPLHRYFEWDDRRAAEGFRQLQAGRMVRSIQVYTVSAGQERSEPAFRPITVEVVASQQPAAAAPTMVVVPPAGQTLGSYKSRPAARAAKSALLVAAATTADNGVQAPRDADAEEVIGRAMAVLEEWEQRFRHRRSHPAFAAIFEPVFAAIAEARARDGATI